MNNPTSTDEKTLRDNYNDPFTQGREQKSTTEYGSLSNPYGSISYNPGESINTIAPMLGVPTINQKKPDFLYFDARGRGWMERTFYNVGLTYTAGLTVGVVHGVFDGYRSAPSKRLKFLVNSVLNKAGRSSSRVGNAVAVLAFVYSCCEYGIEQTDLENKLGIPGEDLLTPVLAATITGVAYKSTSMSPRVIVLAGAVGGGLALAAFGTKLVLPSEIKSTLKGYLFF